MTYTATMPSWYCRSKHVILEANWFQLNQRTRNFGVLFRYWDFQCSKYFLGSSTSAKPRRILFFSIWAKSFGRWKSAFFMVHAKQWTNCRRILSVRALFDNKVFSASWFKYLSAQQLLTSLHRRLWQCPHDPILPRTKAQRAYFLRTSTLIAVPYLILMHSK